MGWVTGVTFITGIVALFAQAMIRAIYPEKSSTVGTVQWKWKIILMFTFALSACVLGLVLLWETNQGSNNPPIIPPIFFLIFGVLGIWDTYNQYHQRKTKWIYIIGGISLILLIIWEGYELWQSYQIEGRMAFFNPDNLLLIAAIFFIIAGAKEFISFTSET